MKSFLLNLERRAYILQIVNGEKPFNRPSEPIWHDGLVQFESRNKNITPT